jgi:hypothetical protein
MDTSDELRLARATAWLHKERPHFLEDWLPDVLLDFEKYLLECEAERQRD